MNQELKDKGIDPDKLVINNTWVCIKKISSGSFGTVYEIKNKQTKELLAAKIETKNSEEDILSVIREATLIKRLQSIAGVPRFHWSGSQDSNDIMVFQLLGKDLGSYLRILKKFSIKTICEIGVQCLRTIQQIHQKNIIHRDLKPENILMGRAEETNKVYIVDFGISKYYKDAKGKHIPFRTKKSFIGTTRYAPISAHLGYELCCKDDLESLGYVLVYLGKGKLPWQNMNITDKDKTKKVGEAKIKTPYDRLCKGLPQQFVQFFQYLKSFEFSKTPDYDYLIGLFHDIAKENDFEIDMVMDWNKKKKKLNSNKVQGGQFLQPKLNSDLLDVSLNNNSNLDLSALSSFKLNDSNRAINGASFIDLEQFDIESYMQNEFQEHIGENLNTKMRNLQKLGVHVQFKQFN